MTHQQPLPPLPPLDQIAYCSESGDPILWMWYEAWRYKDGAWKQENPATAAHESIVTTKAEFDERFGVLPPLPAGAFTPPVLS